MIELSVFEAVTRNSRITYHVGSIRPGRSRGLLVVVHGRNRSARLHKAFAEKAYEEGFTVLAPVFDMERYKDFHILRGQAGPLAAADALDAACSDVAQRLGITPTPFVLFGFSAGAQFAHRYAMRYPKQVARLVAAASGWYTMPYPDLAFPLGCAPSVDMQEGIQDLVEFFRIPTRVMVGENDIRRDNHLRTLPAIDKDQGLHRLERARRWVNAVTLYAMDRGLSPQISLEILPRTDHSAAEAIRNGALVQRTLRFLAGYMVP